MHRGLYLATFAPALGYYPKSTVRVILNNSTLQSRNISGMDQAIDKRKTASSTTITCVRQVQQQKWWTFIHKQKSLRG